MADVLVPIRLVSAANAREHHMARARRVKNERYTVYYSLLDAKVDRPALPCVVTITRIAPRAENSPLDDDNLVSGAKGTRDAIAEWMKVDDGSRDIQWRYAQEKGKPKEYAVRISFGAA